jgi:glutathione-independent formaldehyde dehydrogenase
MGDVAGMVIGHEPLGVVAEVGSAVVSVQKGDRVTVPTHICCGFCYNCVRGYSDACLTTHPGATGAAYGGAGGREHGSTATALGRRHPTRRATATATGRSCVHPARTRPTGSI